MEMQQMLERLLAGQAKAEANHEEIKRERIADREHMHQMLAKMEARIEENNEKFEVLQGTLVFRINAWTTEMKAEQKETMACQQTTEARLECKETTPKDTEAMHRKVPMKDAVVKPVGGRKKRQRGRHISAGRLGKPKELTRGDCGSRGKLAAACRKVSRCAAVAWRKRIVVRKDLTRYQVEWRNPKKTKGREEILEVPGM
jgi:hypothetical protein